MPAYLSFIGVDERTNIEDLSKYSYNRIEFGFLLGNQHSGKNRYPSIEFIKEAIYTLTNKSLIYCRKTKYSIHLCGAYAESYLNNTLDIGIHNLLGNFDKVQINASSYPYDKLITSDTSYNKIVQFRGDILPAKSNITYLIDKSGGKGVTINSFPYMSEEQHVGVAGGINISNISEIINKVPYNDYYLDMETGCRTNDWFDLDLCNQIYRKVYYA